MFVMLTVLNPVLTSYGRGLLGWRFLASSILLHFLGFYAFDNEQQVWRLLRVFWFTAVLVCLYGFLQLWRGYTAVELAWIEELAATMKIAGTDNYRLMSTMGSAVDLSFFLALAITTIFGLLLFRWRQHWPYLIHLALFTIALLFTYVRAAWVAALGGCLFLLALYVWRDKRLRLLYPSLLALALILVLLYPSILRTATPYVKTPALQLRLLSLADPLDDKSMQDRFQRWNEIWQVITAYPQGIGVGMTGAASLRYADEPSPAPITPDNTYLRVLLETGWIGLLLFLWLLLSILFRGLMLSHQLRGSLQLLARCLTSAHIAFLIILLFGEYIELNPGRSIIWIFTGLLFSLPRFRSTMPSVTVPDEGI
jgi:O-antigen ligase